MRLLAVQIGNATSSVGLFNGMNGEMLASWAITTSLYKTPDEIRLVLKQLLREAFDEKGALEKKGAFKSKGESSGNGSLVSACCVDAAIIASVVPQQTNAWIEAVDSLSKSRSLVVGPGLKTGVTLHYNDPAGLGADRVAAIVAAHNLGNYPLVAVNFGASTTLEVIDSKGRYIGGVITPGTQLSAQAITHSAAQLISVGLAFPRSVVGKNSREAVQSGIMLGELCRVEGLVALIEEELDESVQLVFGGEYATLFASLAQRRVIVEKDLVLNGLYQLFARNRSKV